MGLNRFLSFIKLGENDEEDDYYDDDYEVEDEPVKTSSKKFSKKYDDDDDDDYVAPQPKVEKAPKPQRVTSSKVVPLRQQSVGRSGLEVCVIKPTSIEDAREISDTLNTGRAVILNLEGLPVDIAQRIIDFTSGACYSTGGNLQKISQYIFICTPESVDVSGDFQTLINGEFEFNTI